MVEGPQKLDHQRCGVSPPREAVRVRLIPLWPWAINIFTHHYTSTYTHTPTHTHTHTQGAGEESHSNTHWAHTHTHTHTHSLALIEYLIYSLTNINMVRIAVMWSKLKWKYEAWPHTKSSVCVGGGDPHTHTLTHTQGERQEARCCCGLPFQESMQWPFIPIKMKHIIIRKYTFMAHDKQNSL